MVAQKTRKGQRSCIACGKKSDKSSLYRVVRSSTGVISFDATGRVSGRGAYVCSLNCFDTACQKKKFDWALHARLTSQDYENIKSELERICGAGVEMVEE